MPWCLISTRNNFTFMILPRIVLIITDVFYIFRMHIKSYHWQSFKTDKVFKVCHSFIFCFSLWYQILPMFQIPEGSNTESDESHRFLHVGWRSWQRFSHWEYIEGLPYPCDQEHHMEIMRLKHRVPWMLLHHAGRWRSPHSVHKLVLPFWLDRDPTVWTDQHLSCRYWLLLRGGIVQSVSSTASIFWSIVSPSLSSNHSWFIHWSSPTNSSRL
jgi:hypothetical protein